jgi:hypothetical protein
MVRLVVGLVVRRRYETCSHERNQRTWVHVNVRSVTVGSVGVCMLWKFNRRDISPLERVYLQQNKKGRQPRVKSVTPKLWWVEKTIKLLSKHPAYNLRPRAQYEIRRPPGYFVFESLFPITCHGEYYLKVPLRVLVQSTSRVSPTRPVPEKQISVG